MSRFYGSVEGQAVTLATRRGSESSGIIGHVRGWEQGVKVYGYVERETGAEVFEVFLTGGSNDPSARVRLARIVDGKVDDVHATAEVLFGYAYGVERASAER